MPDTANMILNLYDLYVETMNEYEDVFNPEAYLEYLNELSDELVEELWQENFD